MDASTCIKSKLTWTLLKYAAYPENKRHSLKTKKLFDICYVPYLEYVYMNEPKGALKKFTLSPRSCAYNRKYLYKVKAHIRDD